MKKIFLFLLMLGCSVAFAKDHEIKMLDMNDKDGTMVFEPGYIYIEPGDSVTFVPTHKSHFAQSKVVPEGADNFLSELDQRATFTLNKEGVYVYECPPHRMMNMVGIIQVGKPTNLEKVKEMVPKLERRATTNKGRLAKYAEEIKE